MRSDAVARGHAAAREVTRARAKTFAFASLALDTESRRAAFAVYAFCRRADDAVDGGGDVEGRRARLARVREDVRAAYAQDVPDSDPALCAFAEVVRSRAIPMDAVLGLLEGMAQDLEQQRYRTWGELLIYCELAAGTVGRMMAAVFGARAPDAATHAAALGRAMQLTNVLRDVREDLEEHGRVYLPGEALASRGLGVDDLRAFARQGGLGEGGRADAFRDLMREAAVRARTLYSLGARGVHYIPSPSGRACVRSMGASYAEILRVLAEQRWDPFCGRARTSTRRKMGASVRAMLAPAAASP